jgi:hypothetical protein
MVVVVNIHRSKGRVFDFLVLLVSSQVLSSLFLAPHNKLQSFATYWFDGLCGGGKS